MFDIPFVRYSSFAAACERASNAEQAMFDLSTKLIQAQDDERRAHTAAANAREDANRARDAAAEAQARALEAEAQVQELRSEVEAAKLDAARDLETRDDAFQRVRKDWIAREAMLITQLAEANARTTEMVKEATKCARDAVDLAKAVAATVVVAVPDGDIEDPPSVGAADRKAAMKLRARHKKEEDRD